MKAVSAVELNDVYYVFILEDYDTYKGYYKAKGARIVDEYIAWLDLPWFKTIYYTSFKGFVRQYKRIGQGRKVVVINMFLEE